MKPLLLTLSLAFLLFSCDTEGMNEISKPEILSARVLLKINDEYTETIDRHDPDNLYLEFTARDVGLDIQKVVVCYPLGDIIFMTFDLPPQETDTQTYLVHLDKLYIFFFDLSPFYVTDKKGNKSEAIGIRTLYP